MGKAYDGKKRWIETVLQTNAVAAAAAAGDPRRGMKKRFSGRTVKLSKAMREVDDATRASVRNARLDALEADNYGEDDANGGDDGNDDAYVDEENDIAPFKGRKKAQRSKGARLTTAKRKAKRWKVKSLAQLVFEEYGTVESSTSTGKPTYLSVAAAPSTKPARKFCGVCGFFAAYQCKRCGTRFCRVKCGDQHQESGCLKFGL